ncbi:hypothetical protein HQ590_09105, partial [bacterium]|nr:hypothetical protein [bacterium]
MSAEAQPGDGGTRPPPQQAALDRARQVRDALPAGGLFAGATWRTALAAFPLTAAQVRELEALGPQLLAFYRASNILYRHSVTGKLPGWIAEYLDRGKPPALVELSRQGRLKGELPRVIRPDVILTNDHFFITELDSVPGGIGLTGWLGKTYAELGEPVVGGATGMMAGFDAALQAEAKGSNPVIAVVVSEEAATYRPEMEWLGQQMGFGVLRPEEMRAWLGEIAVRSEMRDASGESRLGGSLALPTA